MAASPDPPGAEAAAAAPGPQPGEQRAGLFRSLWPLALILIVAAALRFYGLDWDGGHWLHPDERQIYFVAMDLGWPRSVTEALSVSSPLNPAFFAYGSLPIYLLRIVASLVALVWPAAGHLDNLHLVGRSLAAIFDLSTVCLTYRLASKLWPGYGEKKKRALALLAAGLVGVAVLHVQLAHFYTVDPLLVFFVMLALNWAADVALGGGWLCQVGLGLAVGLALATKVSALPLLLVVPVAYDIRNLLGDPSSGSYGRDLDSRITHPLAPWPRLRRLVLPIVATLAMACLVFVLTQPYVLIDWQTFVEDTFRESGIARGVVDVPYTLQYAGTLPYLYPVWQTALWGLGLPLGLVAWTGLAAAFVRWLIRGAWADALLLAWAGPYFVLTGVLHSHYLRYMLPLAPVLCLLAARLLAGRPVTGDRRRVSNHLRRLGLAGAAALVVVTLAYALAFVRIYARPHSWVAASEWIFAEIPATSTLAIEHWDMPLPLPVVVEGKPQRVGQYYFRTLPLYDEPDDPAKWQALAADLAGSDYVIVASRRLYGSIPRVPERYPVATRYYDLLTGGELGFELVGEFTRGPAWLNPRLPPLSGPAPAVLQPDESFVVYDHPRALIFANVRHLPVGVLLKRLGVEP